MTALGNPVEYTTTAVVASNIRALCARRGLSQRALGAAIGMAQRTVSERWWGARQWQLEDLDKVAAVLGTSPWALCRPPDDMARPEGFEPPTFWLGVSDHPCPVIDLWSRERVA